VDTETPSETPSWRGQEIIATKGQSPGAKPEKKKKSKARQKRKAQ